MESVFGSFFMAVLHKVHRQTDTDPIFPLLGLLSEQKLPLLVPIAASKLELYAFEH